MFSITVAEASAKLGVSPARVRQLIRSGVLAAEQVAGIWLIDEKSVEARREHNPGRGRPSARLSQPNISRYLLMNRDHEVLAFRFDASTGEFLDADEIIDAKRAPLSIMSPRGTKASKTALSYWWCHRAIPKARHGIEAKLVELGVADTYDLPFKSMGLSLSDQYWIKPYGSEIRWSDVNYFENDFSEAPVEEWMADVGLDSPDNTSDGVLSKRWVCRNGERCLLKGGTLLDQEPYNEVIATELFSRLLSDGDYVPYTLIEWGGAPVSSCPNFVGPTEEFIPAYYVNEVLPQVPHRDSYRHYVECCVALGVEDIETALGKMILCDDIMANTDRHWRNFGLIRDVETLEYRAAPLFDTEPLVPRAHARAGLHALRGEYASLLRRRRPAAASHRRHLLARSGQTRGIPRMGQRFSRREPFNVRPHRFHLRRVAEAHRFLASAVRLEATHDQAPPCPSRPENAHKDISVKASREEAAPSLLFPCRLGS